MPRLRLTLLLKQMLLMKLEAKAADDAEAESNDANAYADAYVPEDAVADAVNGEGGAALICGRGAKSAMLKERLRISKLSLGSAAMMFCGAAWGYSNAAMAAGALCRILTRPHTTPQFHSRLMV